MGDGAFSGGTSPSPPYSPRLLAVLKRLDQLVDWERQRRSGPVGASRAMRVNCEPARELLIRLNSPHLHFKPVHITGSKGKGSVAILLAAALSHPPFTHLPNSAGSLVGTYSSPHVERINERIRLNNTPIADHALANALSLTLDARMREPQISESTWFDVMSAAAMLAFHQANVAHAVVEVGMGGRLDSTNVLDAPVSVITNIHNEHADIIGPTLEDIAYEKAGIISADASVIVGMSNCHSLGPIFKSEASKHSPPARIEFCPPLPQEPLFRTNLRTARVALRAIARQQCITVDVNAHLSERFARMALSQLPARQEMFTVYDEISESSVHVMLDGAHIPASVSSILAESPWHRPVVVLAVGTGKDLDGIGQAVVEHACHVVVTEIGSQNRYAPASATAQAVDKAGSSSFEIVCDADDALLRAVRVGSELRTGVVILGSLHLAGRLRPLLREKPGLCRDACKEAMAKT